MKKIMFSVALLGLASGLQAFETPVKKRARIRGNLQYFLSDPSYVRSRMDNPADRSDLARKQAKIVRMLELLDKIESHPSYESKSEWRKLNDDFFGIGKPLYAVQHGDGRVEPITPE